MHHMLVHPGSTAAFIAFVMVSGTALAQGTPSEGAPRPSFEPSPAPAEPVPPAEPAPAPAEPAPAPAEPAPAPAEPAPATAPVATDPSLLGGPGESCRARADCQRGLRCIEATCRDEREGMACGATADCGGLLRCVDNVCVNPGAKGSAESTRKSSKWGDFKLEGVHGFVGLDLAGGPSMPLSYESGDTADIGGSLLFAFRGGLTFGVGEFGVEFSPMTFRPYLDDSFAPDPNLQLLSYIGTRIPLAGSFYYAMRMGLGIIAVNTPNDEVLFQQRFDLVGFGFNVGHVFFDFHLPSFRHMTDFETGSIFMWQPGMAANYVF